MAQCVTCGSELHPERAEKYDYCMAPECQEKNLKGLTMVAIGVNKAAEQYLVLDEHTRDEVASGKYHDQRRGSFGTSVASTAPVPPRHSEPVRRPGPVRRPDPVRRPGPVRPYGRVRHFRYGRPPGRRCSARPTTVPAPPGFPPTDAPRVEQVAGETGPAV